MFYERSNYLKFTLLLFLEVRKHVYLIIGKIVDHFNTYI